MSNRILSNLAGSLILLGCLCEHAVAERSISYSPEQWPTRWSSTMRQQQSGRYPERYDDQMTDDAHSHVMLEDDLFAYSPDVRRRYQEHRERRSSRDRRGRYEDRDARFRERRETKRLTGWSSAYGGGQYAYPANGYWPYPAHTPAYAGYGLYGIDPVMGYPGLGLGYPSLFAPTFGYPLLGYPGVGLLGAPYLW